MVLDETTPFVTFPFHTPPRVSGLGDRVHSLHDTPTSESRHRVESKPVISKISM